MVQVIRFLQNSLNESEIVWKAVGALSLGALLGALVAVPYDQVLGFPEPLYAVQLRTAAQSLITTATLFRVWVIDRSELVLKASSCS